METFKGDSETQQSFGDRTLDTRIIGRGWIMLYCNPNILQHDLEVLTDKNYQIQEFDCRTWTDVTNMHVQLQKRFDFPDYYGRNFNALHDCLSSDLVVEENGLVVVFRHLDCIEPGVIHMLLDVFVTNARQRFVFGRKLLILGHVDDPGFHMNPVGAIGVHWNDEEWANTGNG